MSIAALLNPTALQAQAPQQPNIIFIMGDDIGWNNIGVYNQGIMSGRTPNSTASPMRVCASPTITLKQAHRRPRELHNRRVANPHGLTTLGQAGSPLGMPDQAPTIATVLKSMGYATGQFGKNHLGDLNKFLPNGAWLR